MNNQEPIRSLHRKRHLNADGGGMPPPSVACKVCGGESPLFGVVDFNKSCHESEGSRLPFTGVPVYYHRCGACGFLFTGYFDGFTQADFKACIYNDDYASVDPDFAERRPKSSAQQIGHLFGDARSEIALLDYGGGKGTVARILGETGWRAESYDPFYGERPDRLRRFDLVTCFEVFEHVPDPKALIDELSGLLAPEGLLLFSTLVQPDDIDATRLNWWYAAPRNGHISLYAKRSLGVLCQGAGLTHAYFNTGLHVAFRELPAFARHLFPQNEP